MGHQEEENRQNQKRKALRRFILEAVFVGGVMADAILEKTVLKTLSTLDLITLR